MAVHVWQLQVQAVGVLPVLTYDLNREFPVPTDLEITALMTTQRLPYKTMSQLQTPLVSPEPQEYPLTTLRLAMIFLQEWVDNSRLQ